MSRCVVNITIGENAASFFSPFVTFFLFVTSGSSCRDEQDKCRGARDVY